MPVGLRLQLRLAGLQALLARGHHRTRLDQLAVALGDATVLVAQLGLALAERRLTRRENRLARLDSRRCLGGLAVQLGQGALERALALGKRCFLLRELADRGRRGRGRPWSARGT